MKSFLFFEHFVILQLRVGRQDFHIGLKMTVANIEAELYNFR